MLQLLLHLFGDYILQSNKMAMYKAHQNTKLAWTWVTIHSVTYGLPFLLIGSVSAVSVIILTHMLIDRYMLAKYIIFAKNWVWDTQLKWRECQPYGYSQTMPPYLAVWLYIITDNTMHLFVNYLALKYL